MPRNLKQVVKSLPKARRMRIEARAAELIAKEATTQGDSLCSVAPNQPFPFSLRSSSTVWDDITSGERTLEKNRNKSG